MQKQLSSFSYKFCCLYYCLCIASDIQIFAVTSYMHCKMRGSPWYTMQYLALLWTFSKTKMIGSIHQKFCHRAHEPSQELSSGVMISSSKSFIQIYNDTLVAIWLYYVAWMIVGILFLSSSCMFVLNMWSVNNAGIWGHLQSEFPKGIGCRMVCKNIKMRFFSRKVVGKALMWYSVQNRIQDCTCHDDMYLLVQGYKLH